MNTSQIFEQYEDTDAELIAIDVLESNLTAYRADFNSFSEMVVSDGRVVRQVEQPGGGATYSIVENLGMDWAAQEAYMSKAGEWTEQTTENQLINIIHWIAAVEK